MEEEEQQQQQQNQVPLYISLNSKQLQILENLQKYNIQGIQIKQFPTSQDIQELDKKEQENFQKQLQNSQEDENIEEVFKPFEKLEDFFPKKIPPNLRYFLINHSSLLQKSEQKSLWITQQNQQILQSLGRHDRAPQIIEIQEQYINYYKQFTNPLAKNVYKFNFNGVEYAAKELSYQFPINGSELKSQLQSRQQSNQHSQFQSQFHIQNCIQNNTNNNQNQINTNDNINNSSNNFQNHQTQNENNFQQKQQLQQNENNRFSDIQEEMYEENEIILEEQQHALNMSDSNNQNLRFSSEKRESYKVPQGKSFGSSFNNNSHNNNKISDINKCDQDQQSFKNSEQSNQNNGKINNIIQNQQQQQINDDGLEEEEEEEEEEMAIYEYCVQQSMFPVQQNQQQNQQQQSQNQIQGNNNNKNNQQGQEDDEEEEEQKQQQQNDNINKNTYNNNNNNNNNQLLFQQQQQQINENDPDYQFIKNNYLQNITQDITCKLCQKMKTIFNEIDILYQLNNLENLDNRQFFVQNYYINFDYKHETLESQLQQSLQQQQQQQKQQQQQFQIIVNNNENNNENNNNNDQNNNNINQNDNLSSSGSQGGSKVKNFGLKVFLVQELLSYNLQNFIYGCYHYNANDNINEIFTYKMKAYNILQQLARAIAVLEENNISHIDLKPPNIMIDNDQKVKIIDFGSARRIDDNENFHFNGVCVTYGYSAPELLLPKPQINGRNDIWSFGIIMMSMLTGLNFYCGKTELYKNQIFTLYKDDEPQQIHIFDSLRETFVTMNSDFEQNFGNLTDMEINLIKGCAMWDAGQRCSGNEAAEYLGEIMNSLQQDYQDGQQQQQEQYQQQQ